MKCKHCGKESNTIELLKETAKNLTAAQKEKLIDDFLAGWSGLKESRQYARGYLETSFWDVKLAQDKYWREA